jgi:hypothetical protein
MAKHGKTKSGVERAFSEFHSIYKPNSGGRGPLPSVLGLALIAVPRPRADAIANMAVENYVEMMDKVGDAKFLLQKEVRHGAALLCAAGLADRGGRPLCRWSCSCLRCRRCT